MAFQHFLPAGPDRCLFSRESDGIHAFTLAAKHISAEFRIANVGGKHQKTLFLLRQLLKQIRLRAFYLELAAGISGEAVPSDRGCLLMVRELAPEEITE